MGNDDDQRNLRYAKDPPFGWRLLADRELAGMWLLIRIYVALAWLVSAMFLLQNAESLAGTNAAHAIAELGPGAKTYAGPGLFLLLGATEAVVSVLLLFGAFAGPVAAVAILLSFNSLVPGPGATDPIVLGGLMALVLAWKVSGWYGLDRWVLLDSPRGSRSPRRRRASPRS